MQRDLMPGAQRFIQAVTEFVFVEDAPQRADVILIPGSRKIHHVLRAAELYRAGYAPWVLPSGRYGVQLGEFAPLPEPLHSEYSGDYQTEWQLHRAVLMKHGVPDSAILREEQATYTWENAQFSREVLKNAGIPVDTAILVCQDFHARRALLYYQAAMPEVRFLVCPAQTTGCTREDWFRTAEGRRKVLGEVQRLGGQIGEVFSMMLEEKNAFDRYMEEGGTKSP